VEAMVDGIVAQRDGYCQQVTVLGHGTSASAAMISNSKNISNQVYQDEVDRIVALSPCAIARQQSLAMGNEDLQTIKQFSAVINDIFEYTQYFGPYFKEELLASPVPAGMDPDQFAAFRDYLIGEYDRYMAEFPLGGGQGKHEEHHLLQMTVENRFQEFIQTSIYGSGANQITTSPLFELYDLGLKPTYLMYSELDEHCPISSATVAAGNDAVFEPIISKQKSFIVGSAKHRDTILQTNAGFYTQLDELLPTQPQEITNSNLCRP